MQWSLYANMPKASMSALLLAKFANVCSGCWLRIVLWIVANFWHIYVFPPWYSEAFASWWCTDVWIFHQCCTFKQASWKSVNSFTQDWLEMVFLPGLMYLMGLMWNHASPSLCGLSLCRPDSILVMWNEPLSRREKRSFITNSMVITAPKTTMREEGLSRQTEQSEASTLWPDMNGSLFQRLCPCEAGSETLRTLHSPHLLRVSCENLIIITTNPFNDERCWTRGEDFKGISDIWPYLNLQVSFFLSAKWGW